MENGNAVPVAAPVRLQFPAISTSKSYTINTPREYDLFAAVFQWHIEAKKDDGGDFRKFKSIMDRYEATSVRDVARDYYLAFRDAWLSDRTFNDIADEQRERCLETFRNLQKVIITNWQPNDEDADQIDVSALTQGAYYIYSELLDSDLGSEDERYGQYEIYEAGNGGHYVKVFDDGSVVIQTHDDRMTLCMHCGYGISNLVEHLQEEERQAA